MSLAGAWFNFFLQKPDTKYMQKPDTRQEAGEDLERPSGRITGFTPSGHFCITIRWPRTNSA